MSDAGLESLYREVILDHYKNPRGHGVIEDADAEAEGQNPLCGDEVSIYVEFGEDGETIDDVKFSGRGCAISQAATSMLTEMVQGRSATEIAQLPKEELLDEIEGVTVYGPPADRRAGIVSFNVDGVHPHDVSQILDWENVAIRGGHHCTQPLMKRLGVAATCRASFYVYSIREEVDRLVDGVAKAKQAFA